MKNILLAIMSLLLFTSCSHKDTSTTCAPVKVMSFNIRYDNPQDSANSWSHRKDMAADAIRFYDPDIVGTQEVLAHQLSDLKERLTDYEVVGVGRDDGKQAGEYAALWFKRDRWELLDSGNFWLSATPDVAGSLGWDAACVRIATWAKLRDRSCNREILALNTHLDHVGTVARSESVKLLLHRIDSLANGIPAIVTGDFNSTPQSSVIRELTDSTLTFHLTDTRNASPLVYGPAWTYHDFGRLPYADRELIDYVFVTNGLTPIRYGVMSETIDEAFLSDHSPVLVTLQ